jgi:predicted small metal-binding protein
VETAYVKFECKELGTNCSYVAQGDTLDEVKKVAMSHTQTVHKNWLVKMSPQQKADLDQTLTRMTH